MSRADEIAERFRNRRRARQARLERGETVRRMRAAEWALGCRKWARVLRNTLPDKMSAQRVAQYFWKYYATTPRAAYRKRRVSV